MASRRPLVVNGGQLVELPLADTLAGAKGHLTASGALPAASASLVGYEVLHEPTGTYYTCVECAGATYQWVEFGPGANLANNYRRSATAPSNPVDGMRWVHDDTGICYTRVTQGNGVGFWIALGPN